MICGYHVLDEILLSLINQIYHSSSYICQIHISQVLTTYKLLTYILHYDSISNHSYKLTKSSSYTQCISCSPHIINVSTRTQLVVFCISIHLSVSTIKHVCIVLWKSLMCHNYLYMSIFINKALFILQLLFDVKVDAWCKYTWHVTTLLYWPRFKSY